jgi:hypothetical protein
MTDVKSKTLSSLLTGCLVLVGTAGATSALVVGCGGDDNNPPPAGDAGGDGSMTDAPNDVSRTDGTAPDGSGDAAPGDAGLDSGDAADAQDAADAAETSVLQASQYVPAATEALCTRFATCCAVDAGAFNMPLCLSAVGGNPIGLGEATPYLDSGLVSFNAVQAEACLTDIANYPCGTVSATQNVMLGQDCIAAYVGASTTGGPCQDPIECPQTDYCNRPGDGGTGVCTALVGDGGGCSDNTQCSYLGYGEPELYCNTVTGTCLPQLANGADCTAIAQCQSQICEGSPLTCSATYVFSDPGVPNGTCAYLTITDAGGD